MVQVRQPRGERFSFKAHSGEVYQLRYSSDGIVLVTAGTDRMVRLWRSSDLKSGARPLAEFNAHLKYVLAADFSSDGAQLVTGGGDKAIYLWDVGARKLTGRLEGHTADVESVAFFADNSLMLSASEDRSLILWDVKQKAIVAHLVLGRKDGRFVGFTAENERFGDASVEFLDISVDGRRVRGQEVDVLMPYLGKEIAIQ